MTPEVQQKINLEIARQVKSNKPICRQTAIARVMKKMAQKEGHKPKLPKNTKPDIPQISNNLNILKMTNYFKKNDGPIKRTVLAERFLIHPKVVKRACDSLIQEKKLYEKRLRSGIFYATCPELLKQLRD